MDYLQFVQDSVIEHIPQGGNESGHPIMIKKSFQQYEEREGFLELIINDLLAFLFAASDNNRINQFRIFQKSSCLIGFLSYENIKAEQFFVNYFSSASDLLIKMARIEAYYKGVIEKSATKVKQMQFNNEYSDQVLNSFREIVKSIVELLKQELKLIKPSNISYFKILQYLCKLKDSRIPYIHNLVFSEIRKLIVFSETEQYEYLPFEHHFERKRNEDFIKEGIVLLNILIEEPLNQIAPVMKTWYKKRKLFQRISQISDSSNLK